jgi:catechol 2,3-dioxygenase
MGQAVTPVGVNHIVLNVSNIERSHKFWTEVIGFKLVASLDAVPGRRGPMKFYSGVDEQGKLTHHALALAEIAGGESNGDGEPWSMQGKRVGLNHVAVCYPDRESWLRQLKCLQDLGVPFLRRVNHGMTHSVYIEDPDHHGIEVLYELPREVWEHDIQGAQAYAERLPTEGPEALVDKTDNPVFDGKGVPAHAR